MLNEDTPNGAGAPSSPSNKKAMGLVITVYSDLPHLLTAVFTAYSATV